MSNKALAIKIIELMGGSKNITQAWNCMTRIRFTVVDLNQINTKDLESLSGVMGVRNQSGQIQVIVGNKAEQIYEEIKQLLGSHESEAKSIKSNPLSEIINTLAGVFTPVLTAIVAGGMLKAILSLLTVINLLAADSSLYLLLSIISDAPFYFLPFLLAVSSARKFMVNEYLGIALAGILMYPTLINGSASGLEPIKLFFISIPYANYSSSVIPIVLGVWLMSYINRFVTKFIPELFKFIFVPMITLIITTPIMLSILAPLGSYVGIYLASLINYLVVNAAPLAGFIGVGGMSVIVMTGMHYAIIPSTIASLGGVGYDPFLLPANLIANMATAGATFAVGLKSKDQKLRSISLSSGISAIFGITEPAIFGITLAYKKPFFAAMLASGISGAIAFTYGVRAFAFAAPSILALPTYANPDGTMTNLLIMILAIVGSFVLGFIFTFVWSFETNDKNNQTRATKLVEKFVVKSPMKGKVIPLNEVNDKTFSDGIMGKGVAIYPEMGSVSSPCDGEVIMVFHTKHAIAVRSNTGAEILIHIGLETVNLQGKYFEILVKQNQIVKAGDLLVKFDFEAIKKEGYDLTTEIVITNTNDFLDVVVEDSVKEVEVGTDLLYLVKE